MPVPEAPTTPMDPAGATLANASGAPAMQAVPQSGPITISPRSRALVFSATSCAGLTLSENIITLQPSSSARSANSAAYSPAIEISARLAAGSFCRAVRQLRARSSFLPPWPPCAIALSAASSAAPISSAIDSSADSALIATQISFGVASLNCGCQKPVTSNKDLLAGVPIMTDISSTLGDSLSLREINIRLTES